MKKYIFMESGWSTEFGEYTGGDIRLLDPQSVKLQVERDKILEPIDKLQKDDFRKYLARLNIFDIPDNLGKPKMQELVELCTEAVKKGIRIPGKPSPEKLIKLLNDGDEYEPDTPENKEEDLTDGE